ncbi:uncharacterized protein LOC136096349 [Hydra vulgaris]|uniref:uncharacterized protein LOC136096349 n=1 Tax=Hydra vulgaris TaxID=6087 RepID=UPI0032E9F22F
MDIKSFNSSNIDKNNFFLFHLNIASLVKNFDDLNSLLSLINHKFSIIGIPETKLKNGILPTNPLNLTGYVYEHTLTKSYFEALLYISNTLIYKLRYDLNMLKPKLLESVFVEIIIPKKSNIIIGCNFNVDLLLVNSDNSVSELLDTIALNNFLPFISLPTRITNRSKTLIDNIFSNATSTNIFAKNFSSTVSDHLPQFLVYPFYRTKINIRKSCIFHRNLKQINCVELCSDFSKISWTNVVNVNEVPEDLQNKIHSSNTDFNKYLKNPNLNSMFIKPTDKNEVLSIIHSLNDSMASGPNSIPIPIFKALANDISPVLSELFNLSFTTGVFPDILKTASVIPIHKKDTKPESNNYRPISLLSNVSKLLEKLMRSRIYNFLNNSACFHIRHFGFRSNHSTSHALISITEMIRGAINSGSFACGVFKDLQKAFDTVDHNILIKKLNYYGIRGIANHWFSSSRIALNSDSFVAYTTMSSSLNVSESGSEDNNTEESDDDQLTDVHLAATAEDFLIPPKRARTTGGLAY